MSRRGSTLPPAVGSAMIRQHRAPRPVFVDHSGRRRRLIVATGAGLATAIVVALIMLIAGLSGASPLHVPGFPDLGKPAEAPAAAGSQTPGLRDSTAGAGASGTASSASPVAGTIASPSPTSPRRVPTQTPSHAKPTKT